MSLAMIAARKALLPHLLIIATIPAILCIYNPQMAGRYAC